MNTNEAAAPDVKPEQEKNSGYSTEIFEWVEALVFSLVVIILIFSFCFRIITVMGDSMLQTLKSEDKLIVSSINYEPEYGDIVVVNMPNWTDRPFIKRIIATEGQKVDIDYNTGSMVVDGEYLYEPYINEEIREVSYEELDFPVRVPEGHVFVVGDNRNHSTDSRSGLIGCVDERYIMGKAVTRIYPIGNIGSIYDNME